MHIFRITYVPFSTLYFLSSIQTPTVERWQPYAELLFQKTWFYAFVPYKYHFRHINLPQPRNT